MSGPSSLRTPLARVRNLGSSHSGTRDFWRQRLTAVAMALLIVPVLIIVLILVRSNHAGAMQTPPFGGLWDGELPEELRPVGARVPLRDVPP